MFTKEDQGKPNNKKFLTVLIMSLLAFRIAFSFFIYKTPKTWPILGIHPSETVIRDIASKNVSLETIWNRWDSHVYLEIANKGYDALPPTYTENGDGTNHGWLPLYPYIVKSVAFFVPASKANLESTIFYTGTIISNIAFLLALFVIAKITKELDFSNKKTKYLLLSIILFPGSYFFSLFYTESIYLLTTALVTYFFLKRNYIYSFISLSLAFITRVTAISYAIPMAIIILYNDYKKERFKEHQIGKTIKKYAIYILLAILPIFIHYTYMYLITGDFFAVNTWHGIWNHNPGLFRMFTWYFNEFGFSFYKEIFFNLIIAISIAIAIIAFVVKNKQKIKEHKAVQFLLIQSIIYWFIITSAGSYTSVIRFISVNFPFFFLFFLNKRLHNTAVLKGILITFGILQFILFSYFITETVFYSF